MSGIECLIKTTMMPHANASLLNKLAQHSVCPPVACIIACIVLIHVASCLNRLVRLIQLIQLIHLNREQRRLRQQQRRPPQLSAVASWHESEAGIGGIGSERRSSRATAQQRHNWYIACACE